MQMKKNRRIIEKIDKEIVDSRKNELNHYWAGYRIGLTKAKRLIEDEK